MPRGWGRPKVPLPPEILRPRLMFPGAPGPGASPNCPAPWRGFSLPGPPSASRVQGPSGRGRGGRQRQRTASFGAASAAWKGSPRGSPAGERGGGSLDRAQADGIGTRPRVNCRSPGRGSALRCADPMTSTKPGRERGRATRVPLPSDGPGDPGPGVVERGKAGGRQGACNRDGEGLSRERPRNAGLPSIRRFMEHAR